MQVITEAELRELWQNGRGELPGFPADTRFTPAARDFLRDMRISLTSGTGVNPGLPAARRLDRLPAVRIFFTEQDMVDLAGRGETTLALGEGDRLTALAQERAAALGVRIVRSVDAPMVSNAPRSHNLPVLPEPPRVAADREPRMHKTFITELDIASLARSGVTRLEMDANTVLTDLARERALQMGIELVQVASPPAAA